MRFTLNTKPLKDVLDLVIVPANISKFFATSTYLQISTEGGKLKFNTSVDSAISEAVMVSTIEGEPIDFIFVDALTFKQLVSSIDANIITLDITENGVTIEAGRSKFTVARVPADSETQFDKPSNPAGVDVPFDQQFWKSVKNTQMYALAENFVQQQYTNIYNGLSHIMVSDYPRSLFTVSEKQGLPVECLLSPSILNLFLSVEPQSKIYQLGDKESFLLIDITDTYTFSAEFKPKYQSSPNVGSYQAPFILEQLDLADTTGIEVPTALIKKLLSQISLLSSTDTASTAVKWEYVDSVVKLTSDSVDGKIDGKLIGEPTPYTISFSVAILSNIVSNMDKEIIAVYPLLKEGECQGCVFSDGNVSAILAGVD